MTVSTLQKAIWLGMFSNKLRNVYYGGIAYYKDKAITQQTPLWPPMALVECQLHSLLSYLTALNFNLTHCKTNEGTRQQHKAYEILIQRDTQLRLAIYGLPVKGPECPCSKDAFPKYMPLQTMSGKVLEATLGGLGKGGEKGDILPKLDKLSRANNSERDIQCDAGVLE